MLVILEYLFSPELLEGAVLVALFPPAFLIVVVEFTLGADC
jgi:hypothetical protein